MIQQLIVITGMVLLLMAFMYMGKSNSDMIIRYREAEIKSLKYQLESAENCIVTLFNDEDMIRIGNAAYIAGLRVDKEWSAEKWIDETFKSVEPPVSNNVVESWG